MNSPDTATFWKQVRRGIPGLRLSDRVDNADAEAQAWQAWHAYLAARRGPTCHFDSEHFADAMRQFWPKLASIWIADSDRLLAGTLPYCSITVPYVAGRGLDWGANPWRSTSWGGLHYMFFLRWPVRAAMLTGDAKYVRCVAECLQSYASQMDDIRDDADILGMGPKPGGEYAAWNVLAIGRKLEALAETLYALRDHPAWTVDDCRTTSLLIWRFASHLHALLESQTPTEWLPQLNFISTGSSGLGAVGALLPEWTAADSWLELARQVQEVLLLEQVYADGFQKEISTQYHKGVIQNFATLQTILARRGLPSFFDTEPFRARLLAMYRTLPELVMPDGFTAAINSAVYAQDWPILLASGNAFFRDPALAWHLNRVYHPDFVPVQKAGPGWDSAGLTDLATPKPPGLRARAPRPQSRLFPDAGVAVLRDGWDGEANVMVLDFGHPEGGHAYPAQASFSAWVKGRPAALSPGSPFAYSDPEYPRWYHATRGQNTVWIDEDDQESWRPGNKRRIWGELIDWQDGPTETRATIAHDGYLRSKGVRHERTVLLRKGRFFLIHDRLDGTASTKERKLGWTLRCPDELTEGDRRVVSSAGSPGITLIPAWPETIEDVEIGRGPSMVPLAYQPDMRPQMGQTCHVRFVQETAAGAQARFLVLLVAGDCGDATVTPSTRDGRLTVAVTAWGETDHLELR